MPTSIRLDQAIEERLDRLAQHTGPYYLREIIQNGIADLEDYYLAAATAERVRKGLESTVTLKDVERELELGD